MTRLDTFYYYIKAPANTKQMQLEVYYYGGFRRYRTIIAYEYNRG
jgi:hypothetical protein